MRLAPLVPLGSLLASLLAGCVALPPESTEEAFVDGSRESPETWGFGAIEGTVLAAGRPIEGAFVLLDNGALTYTDSSGSFLLGQVPAGDQHVLVYQEGFAVAAVVAHVHPGEVAAVDVELEPGDAAPPHVVAQREGRIQHDFVAFGLDEDVMQWRQRTGALLLLVTAHWLEDNRALDHPWLEDQLALTVSVRRGGEHASRQELAHMHDEGDGPVHLVFNKTGLDAANITAADEMMADVHAHGFLTDRAYRLRAVALYPLRDGEAARAVERRSDAVHDAHASTAADDAEVVETRGSAGLLAGTAGQDPARLHRPLDPELTFARYELEWEPALPLGAELTLRVESCDAAGGHQVVGEATGTSPLRVDVARLTLDALRGQNATGLVASVEPSELTVRQEFRLVASFFRGGEPTPDYSALLRPT